MVNIFQKALNLLTVEKKDKITGSVLRDMFLKSYEILNEEFETINKINVYPVPDGDTGINMLETLRAIRTELLNIENTASSGDVIKKVSSGAFNGSVGNSGIILSEYIHGLELAWQDLDYISSSDFIKGLKKAMETGYKSMDQPKEGTMLSVHRKISEQASNLENDFNSPYYVLISIFDSAKQALLETHFTLPEVITAKTIDSGALGFVLILEGFISAVFDDEIFSLYLSRTLSAEILPFLEINLENLVVIEQEWEVQFNIFEDNKSSENIRNQLRNDGECLIVTFDESTPAYKVHIHIKKPLDEFVTKIKTLFSDIKNIRILDLKEQEEDFTHVLIDKR